MQNPARRWRKGTYAAAHYSPLAQIDRINAQNLHIAWRWKSPDTAIKQANPMVGPSFANESTPLMVGGLLYTSTSLSQVAAIDAASGETKWVYDPKIYENGLGIPTFGWRHRGVAYWRKRRRTHRDPYCVCTDDRARCQDWTALADVRCERVASISPKVCVAPSTATTTP